MIEGRSDAREVWIPDATPVIVLAKVGQLDLLSAMSQQVLLPSPVVGEILRGSRSDPARIAVASGWGTRVPIRYIRIAVRSVGLLDPGEQAVLTLALRLPGSRVILDDGPARKAARQLRLLLSGTVGVILGAK